MSDALTVSVIIPTFRRPGQLVRCLHALALQTVPPTEVLVATRADDGPTRRALALARSAGRVAVTVVEVGRANASVARNRCLERARGDVIAMLDDDTVPRPGWLAALVARFRDDPRIGGVGGPDWLAGVETPPADRPARVGRVQWWGRRVGLHHDGTNAPCDVEWLKGANMSFRRLALPAGGFRQDLRGSAAQFAEDVALALAVRAAGWKLVYDPAVAVAHFPGTLVAGHDHRTLLDDTSLEDAAHNESVAMLAYLPRARRLVFRCWAALVGTRLLPGLVAALIGGGAWRDSFHRRRVVRRGRIAGLHTWRAAQHDGRRTPAGGRVARVCLVTHVVTRSDGQGRVNLELTRFLVRRGYAVTLVASEVDPAILALPGVAWIRIAVPARWPALLRWTIFAVRVRWRIDAAARRSFDVVHLNGAITPLAAHVNTSHFVHAAWRRAAVPVDRHAAWQRSYQRLVTAISSVTERHAYRHALRVVAVSEVVRYSLAHDVGVPPARVDVIHTGVDIEEFHPGSPEAPHPLRESLGLCRTDFLLLFVGDARSARKNVELPLRALCQLAPHFHLAIAGDAGGGPYPALAAELGVASRTHFLGTRDDVASCYRDADALICAAHYEPASLVLLEAMASALPVIAAAGVGNATFLVDGENGFLLRSPGDVGALVWTLQRLHGDPAYCRAVGARARATAEALSWERMGRQYEELYFARGTAA